MKIKNIITMTTVAGFCFSTAIAKDDQDALKAKAKISQEAATATAIAAVPNGKIKSSEIENEDNKLVWSFDISTPKSKNITEIMVDAKTGKVVSNKVETSKDQKAEAAADKAEAAQGKIKNQKGTLTFTHPREINHPYLPLSSLKEDILVGGKGGAERVIRTLKPNIHKSFVICGKKVEALTVLDKETVDGKVAEITRDYFAQDDAGNVYYLGEDVDSYKDGKIVGHDGAWLLGKETQKPGLLLPANVKMTKSFNSEDVPNVTTEKDKIVSTTATATVPAGTFTNCVKIEEHASDGATEFKYFSKNVGCVKEEESDGSVVLQSHSTR